MATQALASTYQAYCAQRFGSMPRSRPRSKARMALQHGVGVRPLRAKRSHGTGVADVATPAPGDELREDAALAALADAIYTEGQDCAARFRDLGVEPLTIGEQSQGKLLGLWPEQEWRHPDWPTSLQVRGIPSGRWGGAEAWAPCWWCSAGRKRRPTCSRTSASFRGTNRGARRATRGGGCHRQQCR